MIRTLTGYEISTLLASYILPEFLVLICGMVLLYLTGITDDLVGVRYRQKFIVQILCASLFPAVGLMIYMVCLALTLFLHTLEFL